MILYIIILIVFYFIYLELYTKKVHKFWDKQPVSRRNYVDNNKNSMN